MIARSAILILCLGTIAASTGCRIRHSSFASLWPFRRDATLDQQYANQARMHDETRNPFEQAPFDDNRQRTTQTLTSPMMMVEVSDPHASHGVQQTVHQQSNPFAQYQPTTQVPDQTKISTQRWQPSPQRTAAVVE
ncbi:MAG: hypothetical protein IID45_01360 [Planctomycetes bacterium]|nr:hypothetical protein [Planctomycetota bacterium]